MYWGLKGGSSINADSGPFWYLGMYFDAAVVFVNFIQIDPGHICMTIMCCNDELSWSMS
jgi:hypothetical protein